MPEVPRGALASQAHARPAIKLYELSTGLHVLVMVTMNVSGARERLPEAVELAQSEPVILERYGVPVAVLLSPERYELMAEAFEEAADVAAFDEAMAEEGPDVSWEQVKIDLGWV